MFKRRKSSSLSKRRRPRSRKDEPAEERGARDTWGRAGAQSDPQALLPEIQHRNAEQQSVFPVSPLMQLHESSESAKAALYEATHLEFG